MRSISLMPKLNCVLPVSLLFSALCLLGCGGSGSTVSTTPPGTATLALSAPSLAFAATTVGSSSAAQTLTLTNSGTATLTFTSFTLSDTTDYALTNSCAGFLSAGGSCTLALTFTPRSAASLPATLSIISSASSTTQTVALTGTGTPVPVPSLTLSSTSLAFGSVASGATSAMQSIMLTNTGTANLTFTSFSLSDSTDYALTNSCASSLAAGGSCTLALTFAPKSVATLPSTLSIVSNASSMAQTVALTGTGTPAPAPAVTLSSTSLSFGSVAAGTTSATQSVTLTNTGTATLTGITVAPTGSGAAAFTTGSNCSPTLAAGASCTITAAFMPPAASAYAAAITITDNAANSPQSIGLSGTGTAPQAAVSPTSAAYNATITNTTGFTSGPGITLSNPGNATLTGIAISIGGTNASVFSFTTTCGATLAAGASCSIAVKFVPATVGSYAATLSIADNATGSPQTVALTGTAISPAATLSATSIAFPSTPPSTTSAVSSVTLTNTGAAILTINGIVLGGANPTNFSESNTCGATLAAGASCSISGTFTPATALASYSATVTLTDNALDSPQTIAFSGTGASPAITRTLLTFPAIFPDTTPDTSVSALYTLINNASKSIDMTMYELVDTTFSADLVSACARGVKVRVLLDASLEKSSNTAAYNQLNTAGSNCSAVFSNTAFQATHEKSILIDGVTSVIMTLNLTSRYYTTTRDFALIENDPADYAAIEATFNADLAAGTPYGGTQGASDFSYTPALGDDLIWSPTTAQAAMLALINNAKSTLLIENEELSSSTNSTIVAALISACQHGVVVHFTIVDSSSYEAQFTTLKNAGCSVHIYPNTSTGLYVHAKVVVADYGLSTQNVYMGSINYSSASMNQNRELGLYLVDNAAVQTLYTTLTADYNGGTPW